jgi:CMP-N-acetylneuraminic acid synthetase
MYAGMSVLLARGKSAGMSSKNLNKMMKKAKVEITGPIDR